jgi:AraC family transcriptional regulator
MISVELCQFFVYLDALSVLKAGIGPFKMILPHNYRKGKTLQTLVENQTTHTMAVAEMHVFETHEQAADIHLRFDQPVIATMLKGKKVMHLDQAASFPFLPGESLILPANHLMRIDFPEAAMQNPTKCLALALEDSLIRDTVQHMNELNPRVDNRQWDLAEDRFQFFNDVAVYQIITRLLFLAVEDHPSKDMFVSMMLRELLVRSIQAETRKDLQHTSLHESNTHRLAHVLRYIKEHLHEKIAIEALAKEAYMSEPHFYKVFKNEIGVSPVEYINTERLKLAAHLLQEPHTNVYEVCLATGFNSLSYFHRQFKRQYEVSPSEYRKYYASGVV